ncbi:MAG TPA: GntR family transcriptional regulator [Steroidobacteraceae bacterium]|jgi:DNA-binding GntR family transcriptional regulator|nr:GntR family transcriptional regulator [Steroidobacteraceae bacterium]
MTEPLVQSMTSQLIVRFRDRILSGIYAPGSALRQDTLAAEFGTSKIPVREALVQLQSEGLVDIFPNRGFQVRPLAGAELDEVFRLRLQIEPAAVARGAVLASTADHGAARIALEQLNEATAAGEWTASGRLNRAFHLLLIVPGSQPVAAEILSRLHTLAQRYVQAHLRPEGRAKRASREHTALLKAWSSGKSREARALIHAHIKSTREDLKRRPRGILRPAPTWRV